VAGWLALLSIKPLKISQIRPGARLQLNCPRRSSNLAWLATLLADEQKRPDNLALGGHK